MGQKAWPPHSNLGPQCRAIPDPEPLLGPHHRSSSPSAQFRFLYFPTQRLILRSLPLPNKLSVDKSVSDFAFLETRLLLVGTKSDESQTESYV